MRVQDGVAAAARNEPSVDREGGHRRQGEREHEACPEKKRTKRGIHRARNNHHDEVVDDLHDGDRGRVRSQREACGDAKSHFRGKQGPDGERVTEEKRQQRRHRDGGGIPPAEPGADHHADDFADRAAGQAMKRCGPCGPVERVHIGVRSSIGSRPYGEIDREFQPRVGHQSIFTRANNINDVGSLP